MADRTPPPDDAGQPGLDGLGQGALFGAPEAKAGYLVLARKYRPATFQDLIGQDAMVTTLRNAFAADRIAQGYMLTGVRGVGKTTTARILARALNYARDDLPDRATTDLSQYGIHCREIMESRHPDVVEMDAASNTGVDNVREIIESARYKPLVARYKVFIIDEVHMLSKGAFNALLKTLEEPPPHVKFIFATTEIRRVPVTVLSRCQRFDLRRVDVPTLAAHLERIVANEGGEAEDEALAVIARSAGGSVRDALSVLDQAIATAAGAEKTAAKPLVTATSVRAMLGLADRGRLFDLLDRLFAGHAGRVLEAFSALHADGADPIQVLEDLAEAVHVATRFKIAGDKASGEGLSAEEKRRAEALAGGVSIAVLSRAWSMLLKGIEEASRAPNTTAAAEMVLIRIAHAADLPSPEDILRTLGGGTVARRASSANGPMAAPSGTAERPTRSAVEPPVTPNDAAPPAMSLEDYGATDPIDPEDALPGDDDRNDTDGTESPAARAPQMPDPRSFPEVMALVAQKRDARLKVHLEEHVGLVAFDASGQIELNLHPGAPPEIANELREKLNKWTGRRWMVAVSRAPGAPPLGVQERARQQVELDALKQHPAVAALLEAFPEGKISSVKPIEAQIEDDQATG
jgi:DNA polymerase III subunit gamma/tau